MLAPVGTRPAEFGLALVQPRPQLGPSGCRLPPHVQPSVVIEPRLEGPVEPRGASAESAQLQQSGNDRPLEVEWLCKPCHKLADKELAQAA